MLDKVADWHWWDETALVRSTTWWTWREHGPSSWVDRGCIKSILEGDWLNMLFSSSRSLLVDERRTSLQLDFLFVSQLNPGSSVTSFSSSNPHWPSHIAIKLNTSPTGVFRWRSHQTSQALWDVQKLEVWQVFLSTWCDLSRSLSSLPSVLNTDCRFDFCLA